MRKIKTIKLIIEVDEKYYEACKDAVNESYPSQIEEVIANGMPFEKLTEADIQKVLNKYCMTAVANEYLIALHNKNGTPKGKWYKTGQSFVNPDKFRNYGCSNCFYELDEHIRKEPNFCPNCGADMRN